MSSKGYTPSTNEVCFEYAGRYVKSEDVIEGRAEFDRWLDQVKAEAVKEYRISVTPDFSDMEI